MHSGQARRTSEDLGVVVAQSQGAHCHDLRDGAEPEDLWVPESLEIPEALRRVPACTSIGSLQTSRFVLIVTRVVGTRSRTLMGDGCIVQ